MGPVSSKHINQTQMCRYLKNYWRPKRSPEEGRRIIEGIRGKTHQERMRKKQSHTRAKLGKKKNARKFKHGRSVGRAKTINRNARKPISEIAGHPPDTNSKKTHRIIFEERIDYRKGRRLKSILAHVGKFPREKEGGEI